MAQPPRRSPAGQRAHELAVMILAVLALSANQARAGAASEIVVTASRANLLGKATSASQGSVTQKEVELRPIYRIGQLFETVPGLVVTIHSGEGKANQYLLRGFNLDHGTDFASFVDGVPVNRPTNAHGQGYSDQNFLTPQLVAGLDYTKGPYYAGVGDFGAVGSAHVRLVDDLPGQISASLSTLKGQDLFVGGADHLRGGDRLIAAIDLSHYDGPWSPPADFNKINAALRFVHGTAADGVALTALYYNSEGRLETDQPQRAFGSGAIGRYGVLDPTDASRSERFSLSGRYGVTGDRWRLAANAYAVHSTMTLYNDFTHFLDDDVNGDQEQQDETRDTLGGDVALTFEAPLLGLRTETTVGLQERHDRLYIDRRHTVGRRVLDYCDTEGPPPINRPLPADAHASPDSIAFAAVDGACGADRVEINDLGAYVQSTAYWTSWLRTEIGLREEDYDGHDHSLITGFQGAGAQTLFQPKGSLIIGPLAKTEFYLSAGRGFHSNDVRGVFGTTPLEGVPARAGKTPFLSPATGAELGLRTNFFPRVQVQIAVFQEDFQSELTYDADAGQDSASAPSRRRGVEVSGQYRPFRWIEINADLAVSRARFRGSPAELARFGLAGTEIANAPSFVGALGVLIDNLGPWYGGLQWRDLGPYPVLDGQDNPRDPGYGEVNLDLGYKARSGLKVQLGVFNLLNARTNAAAYAYAARVTPADLAATGLQTHPLEPISGRLTVTASF